MKKSRDKRYVWQQRLQIALLTVLISVPFATALPHPVEAVDPLNIITYQGRLLNTNGVPVADASLDFEFRFFDDDAGGACLWSNSSSDCDGDDPGSTISRSVDLNDGLFTEDLGDTTLADPYADMEDTVFADNDEVFLEVEIEGETLDPRKRITAAAFALNAQTVDGFDSTEICLGSGVGCLDDSLLWETGVFATFEDDDDVVVGSSLDETIANAGFSLDGNDLFVTGDVGVEGSFYSDTSLIVGATTTYADGSVTTTGAIDLTFTVAGGDILFAATNLDGTNFDVTGATGDITTAGDLALNGDDLTTDGNLEIEATGYVRIGDTAAPTDAAGDDDLFVEGDLEVDAGAFFDGAADFDSTATFDGVVTTTADVDMDAIGGSFADGDLTVDGYAVFQGPVHLGDDDSLFFGADSDMNLTYDEAIDDAFEFAGALVSIGDDPGTSTTATGAGDLLVTDALEIDGALDADGTILLGDDGDTITINSSDWDISSTGDMSGIGTFQSDGDMDLDAIGGSFADGDLTVDGFAVFQGTIQLGDDDLLLFGADADMSLGYDEATDDAFEIIGALVSIGDDPGTSTTATGAGDLLVTGDFEVDATVQLDGAVTTNGAQTFTSDVDMNFTTSGAATENLDINQTHASDAALNVVDVTYTHTAGTAAASNYLLSLTNADNGALGNIGPDGFIQIIHNDGSATIADGILFVINASGMTTALNVSEPNITNAIDVGDNTVFGGTATVDFIDFDVSADGLITLAPDDGGTGITITPSAALAIGLDFNSSNITTDIQFQNDATLENEINGDVSLTENSRTIVWDFDEVAARVKYESISEIEFESTNGSANSIVFEPASAGGGITFDGGSIDRIANLANMDVDVNSANVVGLFIDLDVATALNAGETPSGITVDIAGLAGDDAASALRGISIVGDTASGGEVRGIEISGSVDTAIDLSPGSSTRDFRLDDGLEISQTSDNDLDFAEGGLTLNLDFGETTASTITSTTASNVEIESTANTTNSILIESTVGGIDITASAAVTGEDIDITATGSSVNISSSENIGDALVLTASAAASGVDFDAGTGGFDFDVTGAAALGFDINLDGITVGDGFFTSIDTLSSGDAFEIQSTGTFSGNLLNLGATGVATGDFIEITSTSATATARAINIDLDNGNNNNDVFVLTTDETTVSATAADTVKARISASGEMFSDVGFTVGATTNYYDGSVTASAALSLAANGGNITLNPSTNILIIDPSGNAVLRMVASDGDVGDITYGAADQWIMTGGDINHTGLAATPAAASGISNALATTSTYTANSAGGLGTLTMRGTNSTIITQITEAAGTTLEVQGLFALARNETANGQVENLTGVRGDVLNTSTNATAIGGLMAGVIGNAELNAAGVVVPDARGVSGSVLVTAGTVTDLFAVRGGITAGGGTATRGYGGYFENTSEGATRFGVVGTASGGATDNLAGFFYGSRVQVDDDSTINAPVTVSGSGDLFVVDQVEVQGTSVTAGRMIDFVNGTITSGEGLRVLRSSSGAAFTNTASGLVTIDNDQTAVTSTGNLLFVQNGGVGSSIFVDPNGNTGATVSDTVGGAVHITNTGNADYGLTVYTNQSASTQPLTYLTNDNTSFDNYVLLLNNDSTQAGSTTLKIDQLTAASSAAALDIDMDGAAFAVEIFNDGNLDTRDGINIQGCLDTNPTGACDYVMLRDGNGTILGAIEGNGAGGVTNASSGSDYAELFPGIYADLAAGDIIGLDTSGNAVLADDRTHIIGAFSVSPNTLGNWVNGWENLGTYVPVALLGQVPVHVNNEGGAISPGDFVTLSSTPGVAKKSNGVGFVLGRALEANPSGTGTIKVFVQPSWQAGDILTDEGSATLVSDSLVMNTTGTASAATTGMDSEIFTMRGSGWDGSAATAINMSIANEVTDASTYKLSIRNDASNEVAYVSQSGDLAIAGRFYPSDRGSLQTEKYIYYDGSSGMSGDLMRTNASGWATGSYDFAEMFPSEETLESGQVVVFADENEHVARSAGTYDLKIAGIVSTRPGFLAGDNDDGSYPIALSGRVPTFVTTENGDIEIGDPLTTSSSEGYAMKATEAGPIVGYAMEPFSGDSAADDSIIVFVNVSWYGGEETDASPGVENTASAAEVETTESLTKLSIDGDLSMNSYGIVSIGSLAGISDRWTIEEDGTIKTEALLKTVIESYQNEDVETTAITAPDVMITLVGTAELQNGQATISFEDENPDFNDITSTVAPIRVVVTPNGPVSLYVSKKDNNGFTVKQVDNSDNGITFDWMVSAYRKDYEPEELLEVEAEEGEPATEPETEVVTPAASPPEPSDSTVWSEGGGDPEPVPAE